MKSIVVSLNKLKVSSLILIITISLQILPNNSIMAQKNNKNSVASPDSVKKMMGVSTNLEKSVLKRAVSYQDYTTAIIMVQQLITKEPFQPMWTDSLCHLYFLNKSWDQAILAANDIMLGKYDNYKIGNLLGQAYKNKGDLKEALNVYEKLYASFKDPYHLYDVAQLQYFLKRYSEFNLTVAQLIQLPPDKVKDLEVFIVNSQAKQNVPFMAAVYNLTGVMLMDQNKNEDAKKAFAKALELYPEFQIAKANYLKLNQPAPVKPKTGGK